MKINYDADCPPSLGEPVAVIGGAEIYAQWMPCADRLLVNASDGSARSLR